MKKKAFTVACLFTLLIISLPSIGLERSLPPSQALEGWSRDENLGMSVANAGDVNGDGYDDIIVSGFPSQSPQVSPVYIYYGGEEMDNLPDVSLRNEDNAGSFGCSVAGAGDVNGDGYGDIIVGVHSSYTGGGKGGLVYIYYGGKDMSDIPALCLTSGENFDGFGEGIAGVGDVNGDGFADLAVSAYRGQRRDGPGLVYIFYGGKAMDGLPDLVLSGSDGFDWFGRSLAGAGDVNGDGYADVIIGAPCHRLSGSSKGRAYIYFGAKDMVDTPGLILEGHSPGEYLGWSVAGGGDLNGDGFSDVVVGATKGKRRVGKGIILVYFGGPGMDDQPDVILKNRGVISWFTYSLANVEDINGDGFADMLVASYCGNPWNTQGPLAYLYLGGPGMSSSAEAILSGESGSGWFAWAVAGGGDIDGDRKADLVIGALKVDQNRGYKTYIYTTKSPSNQMEISSSLLPSTFHLGQNYPNPFNPLTTISFQIPDVGNQQSVPTTLKIYNINGQVIRTLIDERKEPGSYLVSWDGRNDSGKEVSSGVYFYRLLAEGFSDSKKMTLIR